MRIVFQFLESLESICNRHHAIQKNEIRFLHEDRFKKNIFEVVARDGSAVLGAMAFSKGELPFAEWVKNTMREEGHEGMDFEILSLDELTVDQRPVVRREKSLLTSGAEDATGKNRVLEFYFETPQVFVHMLGLVYERDTSSAFAVFESLVQSIRFSP